MAKIVSFEFFAPKISKLILIFGAKIQLFWLWKSKCNENIFGAKKIENTHSRLFEWFSNTMMLASSGNLWLLWNRLVKCVEAWISRIIRKTWANTTLTKKMYSTWNMYYLLLHSVSKLSKKVSISNNASKYFKNDFLTFWLLKTK